MAVHLLRSDSGAIQQKNIRTINILKGDKLKCLKKHKICIPLLAKEIFERFLIIIPLGNFLVDCIMGSLYLTIEIWENIIYIDTFVNCRNTRIYLAEN